jgi:hypothetical protein
MAPVNQGSRGALITWTVVTTILFVTATIFAIYYYVESNRVTTEATTTASKFREIVSEAALTSTEVNELKDMRTQDALGFNSSMTLLDVAMKQRDDLARRIHGSPSYLMAVQKYDQIVNDISTKAQAAGVNQMPTSNLEAMGSALANQLVSRQNEVNNLRTQLAEAQRAQQDAAQQLTTAREAMDKQLAEVRASAQAAIDEATADRASKDEQVTGITTDFQTQLTQSQEQFQQAQVQMTDLQRTVESLKAELARTQARLGQLRTNTGDPVVRQADGKIVRVVGGDVVYIDLGAGDQVTPGLTFQVFDKTQGVPPAGDATNDENLPRGKASIEIVRVGPTSSEARIVRTQPGQAITEGDLLVNLVYDRNTKYNFMVFGNFDLDRNNVATPQDADVIRRLVTQWGGALTDKVNVDTDFVVLGAEPVIPSFTREELEDPINQAKYDQARADAEAYEEVRRQAQEYNIPILNQNRFLYFVGFFDLSKR